MKTAIALLVFVAGIQANAMSPIQPKICQVPDLQDSAMVVTLNPVRGVYSQVELFVPTGETSGRTLNGTCQGVEGSIEFALECNIFTSTESGFEISVRSIGGEEINAVVTPWNMMGKEEPTVLPCN